jgi:hypothetical protein
MEVQQQGQGFDWWDEAGACSWEKALFLSFRMLRAPFAETRQQ